MNNRLLISSFILFIFLVTAEIQAQVRTETFDVLNENEHLAYKMLRRDEQNVLQLYAQDINNHENVRLIGEWHPVNYAVQFTNNRRNCFFLMRQNVPFTLHGSLFQYIGDTGEVRLVLDMTDPYRVSRDGKFLVFNLMSMYDWPYSTQTYQGRFIAAVWSVESRQLLSIFDWTVNKNWGSGFMIIMDENDNIMNIYYMLEGGYNMAARAVIRLDTMQFEVLWDITDEIVWGETDVPEYGIDIYQYDEYIISNGPLKDNPFLLD